MAASAEAAAPLTPRPSGLTRFVKSLGLLRESPVGMIGAGIVLAWALAAIFAPLLAPFDPNATIVPFQRPGAVDPTTGNTFWLGTDKVGRDILSRIIYGGRRVLIYGPIATFSAYVVGIIMGLAAGYFRGWWDAVLSRVSDIVLSFPIFVLYVIVISTFGASGLNIVLAIIFASAPGIMRIVRGLTLDLRNRDYVAASQTRGEHPLYIMFVEILPNARGPLIVDACLRLGYVTITIGTLGFLGLGLPPPDPDWGGMVNENRALAPAFPHMIVYPCLAISSLVLGLNLLADGLREISIRD